MENNLPKKLPVILIYLNFASLLASITIPSLIIGLYYPLTVVLCVWQFLFFVILIPKHLFFREQYNNQTYQPNEKELIYKSGIFNKNTIYITYNLITRSEITNNIIDRIFNLAKLNIWTTKNDKEIQLTLTQEEAETIKKIITTT